MTTTTANGQQRYLDLLMQRVREDRYPSLDLLDRLEASLLTDEQLVAYVDLLLDKIAETHYPSRSMLDRVQRLAPSTV